MSNKNSNTLQWILAGLVTILAIAVFVLIVMLINRPAEPPVSDAPETPEGPPPTPIPGDPEQELGNPDGRDDFSTENNWTLFDGDCFMCFPPLGLMVLIFKKGFPCG